MGLGLFSWLGSKEKVSSNSLVHFRGTTNPPLRPAAGPDSAVLAGGQARSFLLGLMPGQAFNYILGESLSDEEVRTPSLAARGAGVRNRKQRPCERRGVRDWPRN